jgi:hypothetical protein
MKVNRVISDIERDELTIRTLKESHTQLEPFKVVPIWKRELVTHSDEFTITTGWKATTGTTRETTSHIVEKFEAFINPGLYKKQIEKPQLSVLSRAAEDIACTLSLALSKLSLAGIITIVLGTVAAGITLYKTQYNKPVLGIILLVLIGVSSLGLYLYFETQEDKKNITRIERLGVQENLFRDHPENLVESVRLIRLLENEANESLFKNIIKMAITAPKKAIEATAALVKKRLPEGSQARRNYLAMLKDAYNQAE